MLSFQNNLVYLTSTSSRNLLYGLSIAFVVAGLIVGTILFFRKMDQLIWNRSSKIKKICEINSKYKFHFIENNLEFKKFYDNKSHFNKIRPADIMAHEFRNNILLYEKTISYIHENRELLISYQKEINKTSVSTIDLECENTKIPINLLMWREERLFKKKIFSPPTELTIRVDMRYSSPKGKVNERKTGQFSMTEIEACINSIARSRLDKSTYSRVAAVERGEVSDSLRYDILRRDNFCCTICGVSSSVGARLHVDHIVPIAKGGKSVPSNLRTLCERCNIGKGAKIENPINSNVGTQRQEDDICPLCKGKLVYRHGRFGDFMGCSSYPQCKYTRKL